MKSPLDILHLEDNPADAELVRSMLEADGITCSTTVVQDRAAFVAALERGGFDLILSDYSLPVFNGMDALEMARTRSPDLPFILVSGTAAEDLAIQSLKSGATDYVMKGRLSRLGSAVRRAMDEVEARAARKGLEQQIIQSQKMEVFGQLASGVAHDFNNILAVIMGYSDLALAKLSPDDPLYRYTEEIELAAGRAVALIRQLLVFSRNETVQPVVLVLNEVVGGMEKMLVRLINENIELTIHQGEAGCVTGDSGYIGQVLMNLVVNARDAMPNGGKLLIETSHVQLDEEYARTHADVKPGHYALLTVSDTGSGMTEKVKERLFEVFFTTKPKGKGTGLGLATCQTIVMACGGHIRVKSELGKGTTFNIYFPRAEHPADVAVATVLAGPMPRGTETVLLVEDERTVRHLARGILQAQGYVVLAASNGQDGLNVAREHKGKPISLVVTDVIMPLMSGNVMADWLETAYPNLKILFTSGYTDDAIAHHGVLGPGIAFLPKPYTPATLTRKVREVLDSHKTREAAC